MDSTHPARAPVTGTEQDKVTCTFFYKTGTCRHGEGCCRVHLKPETSHVVMIPHMYIPPRHMADNPDINEEDHFEDFLMDVLVEARKFGPVRDLVVLQNTCEHMIGNVYICFEQTAHASELVAAWANRYYRSVCLQPELSPVSSFRDSRCRQFDNEDCDRGGVCNFLHIRVLPAWILCELYGNELPRCILHDILPSAYPSLSFANALGSNNNNNNNNNNASNNSHNNSHNNNNNYNSRDHRRPRDYYRDDRRDDHGHNRDRDDHRHHDRRDDHRRDDHRGRDDYRRDDHYRRDDRPGDDRRDVYSRDYGRGGLESRDYRDRDYRRGGDDERDRYRDPAPSGGPYINSERDRRFRPDPYASDRYAPLAAAGGDPRDRNVLPPAAAPAAPSSAAATGGIAPSAVHPERLNRSSGYDLSSRRQSQWD